MKTKDVRADSSVSPTTTLTQLYHAYVAAVQALCPHAHVDVDIYDANPDVLTDDEQLQLRLNTITRRHTVYQYLSGRITLAPGRHFTGCTIYTEEQPTHTLIKQPITTPTKTERDDFDEIDLDEYLNNEV